MSIPGTTMTINGFNLNVLIERQGEPVLLSHGFPDSNYLWRGVIPKLTQAGYKVIAPDQRGFGESDAPEGKENYDMALIAKDAVAVLDALDIEKTVLLALGAGTYIGNDLPFYDKFNLGGIFNISGLRANQIRGQSIDLAKVITYHKVGESFIGDLYVGWSLETGNV